MTSVFISHKRGIEVDDKVALLLADELEKLGCSVYLDLNRPHGIRIDDEIPENLDQADFVIALISAAANGNEWVKGEVERAANLNREFGRPRIVPIRLGFTKDYSPRLAAALGGFDPIRSGGPNDAALLPQVKAALGLDSSFRSIVTLKRSDSRRLMVLAIVLASLFLIVVSYPWLAGWRDGYSSPINPPNKVTLQESASPSPSVLTKNNSSNSGATPRGPSGDHASLSADKTLMDQLNDAHNQTRIGSSENNEKARQLYRDTLKNLPPDTRASLSAACARLLRDAEADDQANNGDAALIKYNSFRRNCVTN